MNNQNQKLFIGFFFLLLLMLSGNLFGVALFMPLVAGASTKTNNRRAQEDSNSLKTYEFSAKVTELPSATITQSFFGKTNQETSSKLVLKPDHSCDELATPIIDTAFLRPFILGSKESVQIYTQLILKTMQEPEVAKYIQFVFTHLQGFKIVLLSEKEVKKFAAEKFHILEYIPDYKIMVFPERPQASYVGYIKHEFRHAFFNTLQRLHNPSSSSANLQRAEDDEESIREMLEYGDKLVLQKLKKLLTKEASQQNTPEEKKYLEKLRLLFPSDYCGQFTRTFKKDMLQKPGFGVGEIISIANNFIMCRIDDITERDGKIITVLSPLPGTDYLRVAIAIIEGHKQAAENAYHKSSYIQERDARLWQEIHPNFIKEFYSDLFLYGNMLLEKVSASTIFTIPLATDQYNNAEALSLTISQIQAASEYHLAAEYDNGVGGATRNIKEIIRLLKSSANKGYASAQTGLAIKFALGEGVPQNLPEAIRLLKLAVAQGDDEAQYSLGAMYFNGDGVPQDIAEATKLFKLAANQGNTHAKDFLQKLENLEKQQGQGLQYKS